MLCIIVNENMHDADAWIVPEDDAYPLLGWERVWGIYESREAAEVALLEAKEYARGRAYPPS
jgi:hypothetical protein